MKTLLGEGLSEWAKLSPRSSVWTIEWKEELLEEAGVTHFTGSVQVDLCSDREEISSNVTMRTRSCCAVTDVLTHRSPSRSKSFLYPISNSSTHMRVRSEV